MRTGRDSNPRPPP